MKRILLLIMPLWVGIIPLHIVAQERVYTLLDWKFKDASQELKLNMSEYKLDFNHPLPYTDMQKRMEGGSRTEVRNTRNGTGVCL